MRALYTYNYAGQPIAWCITDQECFIVMKHFLQSIKDRSPGTQINVLMTDDGKN